MPQITIHSNIPIVRKGLQQLRGAFKKVGRLTLFDAAREIARRMKKPGRKPTYPINWASEKQRLAFFATDGFGGGIPHVRTGRYVAGWKVRPASAGYTVIHAAKKGTTKFISGGARGENQSPIHKGRWPLLRDVADAVIKRLPKAIVDNLRPFLQRIGQ